MQMSRARNRLALLVCAGIMGFTSAMAADYPSKPVRIVVPAPPGGGTDTMARVVGTGLTSDKRWTVVVDNAPGAGGNIGLDRVAKASADGYTLAMGESSNLTVNQYLFKKMPFDVEKDLKPVALVARVPLVLVVSAKGPHATVADLVQASKSKAVTFASSGNGTLGHLVGELWKRKASLNLTHVPYRGAAPAMQDLMGGQTDMFFASITAVWPLLEAGSLRPLAVASAKRSPILPAVPTMAELGHVDIEANVLFGLVTTGGTPDAVIMQLNREVDGVLQQRARKASLIAMGAIPESIGGSIGAFEQVLKADRAKWSQVVKESGATVD